MDWNQQSDYSFSISSPTPIIFLFLFFIWKGYLFEKTYYFAVNFRRQIIVYVNMYQSPLTLLNQLIIFQNITASLFVSPVAARPRQVGKDSWGQLHPAHCGNDSFAPGVVFVPWEGWLAGFRFGLWKRTNQLNRGFSVPVSEGHPDQAMSRGSALRFETKAHGASRSVLPGCTLSP